MKLEFIDARGNRRGLDSAERISASTEYGIEKALWHSGKSLITTFNQQVRSKDKTGRLYIRRTASGVRRRHRASAPGESPANFSGTYRKAIGFKIAGSKLEFGNSAEYAGFLEIGTSRMKPRPGLRNAIRSNERDIIRNLAGGIEESI